MQVLLYDETQYNDGRIEMIVRRGGVRMCPEPKFVISGLNSDDDYLMKIRLELADDYRHCYSNDQWVRFRPAGVNAHLSRLTQLETQIEKGATWHMTIIHFDDLRISESLDDVVNNMIYVEPYHRYIPILSVVHVSSGVSFDVRFEKLQFMAITLKTVPIRRHLGLMDSEDESSPQYMAPYHSYQWPMGYYPYYQQYIPIPYMPYPFQYQYPQIQYPTAPEYIPEYGWNSILVPGFNGHEMGKNVHLEVDLLHEIWAPQEMELENLYYLTEQTYQPLEMY